MGVRLANQSETHCVTAAEAPQTLTHKYSI